MSEFNAKNLYAFFLEKRKEDWFSKKDMGSLLIQIRGTNTQPTIIILQPENEFCESTDFETLLAFNEESGDITIGCDFQATFETDYVQIEDKEALDTILKEFGAIFGYDQIRRFPGDEVIWIGRKDCLKQEDTSLSAEESVLKELLSISGIKDLGTIHTIIIHSDDLDVALFVNPTNIDDQHSWRDNLEVPFFFSNEKTGILNDGDPKAFFYWLKMAVYIEKELPKTTALKTAKDFKVLVVQHDDILDERWREKSLENADLPVEEFIAKLCGE